MKERSILSPLRSDTSFSYLIYMYIKISLISYIQIVEEQPYEDYKTPSAVITRILNAFSELIRSFVIPYTKGPDFSESWLLKLVRFAGLALPTLAAHNPHDYVNVTRLGSDDLYLKLQEQYSQNVSSIREST